MSPEIHVRLEEERSGALGSIDAIGADLAAIDSTSTNANGDDEHDPEGATVAFERAQLASLLNDARATLAAVESAIAKLHDGSYGRCERCGDPIAAERLLALPSTKTCFNCANIA